MRFDINSTEAFLGEFGINQVASRIDTSPAVEISRNWAGDISNGAAEVVDMALADIYAPRRTALDMIAAILAKQPSTNS